VALYPPAIKKLIAPGNTDPRITPRVVILHVAVNESPSLYDYFNGPSGGVESHFYIRRDGTVEQYRDTDWQADANMAANDFAISIETQGMAAGEWTAQQLAAIKALLTWCHTTHGIPLTVPTRWDGSGVGYHILFMQQWAGGPRSCPGPDRVKQFHNVLVPWMAAGPNTAAPQEDDMPLTNADAQTVWTGAAIVKNVTAKNPDTAARVAPSFLLELAAKNSVTTVAQLAGLTAAVKAMAEARPGVDADQLLATVKASVDSGVAAALADLSITLDTKDA